jgi:hypothetical protein
MSILEKIMENHAGTSHRITLRWDSGSGFHFSMNQSYLKGQCHEMVVEVRPWSGRLGLN